MIIYPWQEEEDSGIWYVQICFNDTFFLNQIEIYPVRDYSFHRTSSKYKIFISNNNHLKDLFYSINSKDDEYSLKDAKLKIDSFLDKIKNMQALI